jgi:hypothetical protein
MARADVKGGASRLDRLSIALLAFACLAVIACRVPFAGERLLNVDEAIYSAVADRWLAGEVPYRDTWDNKPPAIYALYAVSFRLLGRSLVPLRVATIAAALVVVFCLYGIGSRLHSARVGALAAATYGLFSVNASPVNALAANTEVFLVAGTGLAAYLLVTGPGRRRSLVGAGAAGAAACLLKPVAAFDLAAFALALVALRRRRHGLGWVALGGLAVCLPTAGYLAWRGALGAAIEQMIGFNVGPYAESISWEQTLDGGRDAFTYFLSVNLPLAALALVGIASLILNDKAPRLPRAIALAWLPASLLAVACGKRFMGHYFNQALPPACLLAGYGLARAASALRQVRYRPRRAALAAALLLVLGVAWTRDIGWPGRAWVEGLRRSRRTEGIDVHDSARAWRIGQYLREHTKPTDRIFAWGFYPQVYLFSDRLPATAFPMCVFLTGFSPGDDPDGATWEEFNARAYPEAWTRLRADFARQPPAYIIDTAPLGREYIIPYDHFPISRYPWLAALVDRDYQLETTIDKVRLYRLRDRHGPPAAGEPDPTASHPGPQRSGSERA